MMIARLFKRKAAGAVICLSILLIGGVKVQADEFTLISAVPDDVFICVAGRGNAEREFIEEYWQEVISALCESGIGADLMGIVGGMFDEQDRSQLDRLTELAEQLYEGVDWSALAGGEMVFAERLAEASRLGDKMTVGAPDVVWLMRGPADGVEKNYTGLVAILETIVAEVNKAAEKEVLAVARSSSRGASLASANLTGSNLRGPFLPITVGRRDDVILITLGQRMLDDVLNLLAGTSDKTALSATPRFKTAFAGLPEAEDGLTFFDMQNLLTSLQAIGDLALAEMVPHGPTGQTVKTAMTSEAAPVFNEAFQAYEAGDMEKALEGMLKATTLAPADSGIQYNVACMHALLGHREKALTWLERAVDDGFSDPNKIANDADLDSLRSEPRYSAALAKAKQGASGGGGRAEMVKRIIDRILDIPGMMDYAATVLYTEGYSTYCDSVIALTEDAKSKPFYPVLGNRAPMANFDRYLPAETVSFTIAGGIDLDALYTFIEDTVGMVGPEGEALLAQWEVIQKDIGFDVRKDLLSWIQGDSISVTMEGEGGTAWVSLTKVSDEAAAREKLAAALEAIPAAMSKLTALNPNPMMAMMIVRISPTSNDRLTGFSDIFLPMQPQPVVAGVADGHLIFGSSAEAIVICLATAKGEHPNLRENPRIMAEALIPSGSFTSMSWQDRRNIGQEVATVFGMVSAVGMIPAAMIPDPQAQQVVGSILQIVGKLGAVAVKVDFYKSVASNTTFDGRVWRARSVTHYRSPAERTAAADGV
ncbi:MAG: hypothetical protein IID37_03070 [Planctomycetes bacterium]|nr:hypothetical protein [Planctomycetota bacterium]